MNSVEIKNRVIGFEMLEWKKLKWLRTKEMKKITTLDKLEKSISVIGFNNPFIVWKENDKNYWILDGHTRELALKEIAKKGIQKIPDLLPCNIVDCKDKKEAYIFLGTLESAHGNVKKEEFENFMQLEGVDLAWLNTVIDIPEIKIEIPIETMTEDESDIEIGVTEKSPIVQLGDVFEIKSGDLTHRIMCGDSTNKDNVGLLMNGQKASCIFTDPPYGVSIGAKNRFLNSFQKSGRNLTDIEDDSLSPEDLKQKLLPAFINIKNIVMSEDCTLFVTAPQGGELGMMMMMMKEAGLQTRHVLIWKKNNATFSMGRLDYDYQHEPILLTWLKKHKRPMMGKHKTSVWEVSKPQSSKEHPTMKPVELYENAYLNNSDMYDNVFDAYSGSGTTLIASESTNRNCYGMELSPKYIEVILRRYKNFMDKNGKQFQAKCLNRDINLDDIYSNI